MVTETSQVNAALGNQANKDARTVSSIAFPYNDLDDAIAVVRTIHEKAGGSVCSPDQLAAAMGSTPDSGTFRLKISAARLFGLVSTGPNRVEITDLGFEIMDAGRQKAAKAAAFLTVPLYRKVYEDFKGKQLPPRPAAFELMIERLGVSPKQKDKARTALDRSAKSSGFYEHGNERLVMPHVETPISGPVHVDTAVRPDQGSNASDRGSSVHFVAGGGGGDDSGRHPFIQGLLKTLPEPETTWTVEGRAKWLQAAANIFDLIYKGDGSITIHASQSKD